MLRWAADSTCVLLTVELDSPSPDEPPRFTVRGARPLAEVTSAARMRLTMDVERAEAVGELALMLEAGEDGRGEVQLTLHTASGSSRAVRLGRDFRLDGELPERLATIEGVSNVCLAPVRGTANLRLVA